ncbi:MAG: GTP cyclohydrolase I, GTP cyclohydrolase I [Candidatus Peregrinibacteria bacterium GW2011_GWE2_39_6]|nr:MAG: GTP cyclohydrolase I, GTP cyclohydrolase I [Candidatus Peregrinibacteria bacterium GW2011_GWF2_39_17]KKR26270.1 MAG: GTP cyclohydrolase I, GTP cyclohydrolase I [Candidatus Peregrinibacteria bacterium GW2011_GWE2_39_6]HCW32410.1 GTP cyclohydrolase I FolE [Candidatus Peregrinibacteria bacterium]
MLKNSTNQQNSAKIEYHISQMLTLIGENNKREGLLETPARVAKSYQKLFSGYQQDLKSLVTVFKNEGYDEMVISKNIEFYSTCEHHMLPFLGKVHIGYIPGNKIIGLSKLPRIVEIFSRRLQNQERMTSQIADALMDLLSPKGVGVVVEAQHLCMMARGVEKQNAVVLTSAVRDLFKNNLNTRSEFLRLIGKS